MAIDEKISEAIEQAVQEAEQSQSLARHLEAWFAAVTSGNEDVHDQDAAERHLDVLYLETDETKEGF